MSELMDNLADNAEYRKAITSVFQLIERNPHADFGFPGPIVHTLEDKGYYEEELLNSLIRKPAPLTIWMYNRLINEIEDPQTLKTHIERLNLLHAHPLNDDLTKDEIAEFITFQEERYNDLE